MDLIPRVSETDRELVAKEFDTRGPDVCMAEVIEQLERENPEFLDIALRCVAEVRIPAKLMVGFGMFYRLLAVNQQISRRGAQMVPRVSAEARDRLVAEIDKKGEQAFTRAAISNLEGDNPELFQMAHNFASGLAEYLHAMQGFALLYRSLIIQSTIERGHLH